MIILKMKKNFKTNFHSHCSLKKGKISVKTEKFIFENKEIPIINQTSTGNARNGRQHQAILSYLKLRKKNLAEIPQIGRLL